MITNNIKLSDHFKLYEFECPCCKTVRLNPRLVRHLELLREVLKKPVVLTSGYRCETRNRQVGGVPRSRHRSGSTADVRVNKKEQETFRAIAERCGFTKIILYPDRNFVHLEV